MLAAQTLGTARRVGRGPLPVFGYYPSQERLQETHTRYMERIPARLLQLDNSSLCEARSVEHRLVGCCRDNALLACAILRHQGRAARVRYGFAAYLAPCYGSCHQPQSASDGELSADVVVLLPRLSDRQARVDFQGFAAGIA
jgi:hypothetical protein